MHRHGETVTVERPNPADRTNKYGDKSNSPPLTHKLINVVFGPSYSTENHEQGNRTTTRWNLYGPHGSDITYRDTLIRADGSRWRVEGVPFFYKNPFSGRKPGFEAVVEQVVG